jgi:hypothetical protein
MAMPGRLTGTPFAGVEEGVVAAVDAIRTPVMVRVVCQNLPFATTTVAGGGVAVVSAPASIALEDDCAVSCLLALPLVTPAPESDSVPLSLEPLSAFAFSDKFASAARKAMPSGFTDTRAAGMEEDAVVNKDAIRTPIVLHVGCQHLPFAAFSSPGGSC